MLAIIEERGPSLGLHVNIPKCEVFCHGGHDLSLFPPSMKQPTSPTLKS